MKGIRPVIAFFLGVLVTGSFFCMEKKQPTAETPGEVENASETINKTSMDAVAFDEIKSRYENYAKEYDTHRKTPGNFKKDSLTQCMWYPIDNFIDSITKLKKDYKATGVRIYFGVYPKGTMGNTETGQKDVGGRLTLFFVGTERKNTSIPGRSSINADIVVQEKGLFAVTSLLNFNEGTLCPPPRDSCKILGATLLP
ncbi:MAG: hypothetical protein V4717_15975 [Bacteroidota bacterium]